MAKLTIVFGVLLILLGLLGYYGTGHIHLTALIPAGFGLLLAVFGLLANTEDTRKRMLFMHIAVTVGLLGFLFTLTAIYPWVILLSQHVFPGPPRIASKAAMSILCLIFVLLCVRSFIAARRTRAQA